MSEKMYKIVALGDKCEYMRLARYFIGRRVRTEESLVGGTYVSFVFPDDALPINRANGWSDTKNKFLLHGAKLVEFKPKGERAEQRDTQKVLVENKAQSVKNNPKSEWQPVRGFEGIYEKNCRGVVRIVKKSNHV